jgi:GNAT superfamily N-acetyltransferase
MDVTYQAVDGVEFAPAASQLLGEAWRPPAMRYTAEYLHWQLSFPAPSSLPAVAAFIGGEPVGFAASTRRRVRYGLSEHDVFVVTFVCVSPRMRGRGIATGLYEHLLAQIRRIGSPVITYAAVDSDGDRVLRRVYPAAGFSLKPLGTYPAYAFMVKAGLDPSDWAVSDCGTDASALGGIVHLCARDTSLFWADPDQDTIRHYFRDPRPRKLLVAEHRRSRMRGAAWAVQGEFLSPRGSERTTMLESVWVPRDCPEMLPALLCCAGRCWTTDPSKAVIVGAPSLQGFDGSVLRALAIRQTPGLFLGYFCASGLPEMFSGVRGTNLEVI